MEGKLRRLGEEVQVQAAIWLAFSLLTCGLRTQQPQAYTDINWIYKDDWLVGVLVIFSFWPYQRLMHFWFYAAFSSVGCIRSKCLRYWSFVWSWHVNLLTYYTLGNGGGFLTDSTHLLMTAPMYARRYKNWRWICTTETAYQHYSCSFKCWKIWGHILYTPQGCGYAVILMFGIF